MNCPNCGKYIDDNSDIHFCPDCGCNCSQETQRNNLNYVQQPQQNYPNYVQQQPQQNYPNYVQQKPSKKNSFLIPVMIGMIVIIIALGVIVVELMKDPGKTTQSANDQEVISAEATVITEEDSGENQQVTEVTNVVEEAPTAAATEMKIQETTAEKKETAPEVSPGTKAIYASPQVGYAGNMQPFYGVWTTAHKDYNEALKYQNKFAALGFDAYILYTTDWSNLNSEPWYVISIGMSSTKDEANSILSAVKDAGYSEAYVKYSGNYIYSGDDNIYYDQWEEPNASAYDSGFYGIWVSASKDRADAEKTVEKIEAKGFAGCEIFETTDWSNLNKEHWYVITAGVYNTKEEAEKVLPIVKSQGYKDAYIKYSGSPVH